MCAKWCCDLRLYTVWLNQAECCVGARVWRPGKNRNLEICCAPLHGMLCQSPLKTILLRFVRVCLVRWVCVKRKGYKGTNELFSSEKKIVIVSTLLWEIVWVYFVRPFCWQVNCTIKYKETEQKICMYSGCMMIVRLRLKYLAFGFLCGAAQQSEMLTLRLLCHNQKGAKNLYLRKLCICLFFNW